MSKSEVQQRASRIANGVVAMSTEFESWLKTHPTSVPGDAGGLTAEVSALRRRARIIARACERPASIAIYGESQVGKSYLVSTLAKGNNTLVQVKLGREHRNFLTEINPEGNKESTGLVTRFSIRPPPKVTEEKPIYLELLSELDIVKIIVNTYYNDIKHKSTVPLTDDVAARAVERARAAARGQAGARHLNGDDVNDLKEYMEREVFTFERLKALTPSVWGELRQLVPHLQLDERLQIYALLWLEEKPLTAAARVLIRALESLNHADAAIVGLEAVLPRERSIIDVETISGFETGDGETIEVQNVETGTKANLTRATLCALTAEVYMQLASPPGGAIDSCDLLDFPGARARTNHDSLATGIAVDGLKLFYRRGKVDFLFKRYTANQELAALLLCRRPGNQEVHDIKNTVYTWIANTLGDAPPKRRGQNPLFVLFTRFDELVAPKTAGGTPASTLENPIKNAFVEFFNQNPSDNWPVKWDERGVFKNCHWYRNPKAPPSVLFQYSNGEETGINPEYAGRIATFRETFIGAEHLNRYFHDPAKAWDSVMGAMDGGVSHIAERLKATIDPAVKFQQLADRITEDAQKLRVRMDQLCVSDDMEQERKKRRDRARKTIISIQRNVMPHQQFGFMIDKLQISPDTLRFPVRKALDEQHVRREDTASVASGYDTEKSLSNVFGDDPDAKSAFHDSNGDGPAPASGGAAVRDVADELADRICQLWANHLQETTGNVNWRRRLRLDEEQCANLVEELIRAAEHQGVRKRLADLVRRNNERGGMAQMQMFDLLVRQIAELLNGFTFSLGYDRVPVDQRPTLGQGGRPVFTGPLGPDETFEASARRGVFNQPLYDSWLSAVWNRANEAIDADTGASIDRIANDKLKGIMVRMTTLMAG